MQRNTRMTKGKLSTHPRNEEFQSQAFSYFSIICTSFILKAAEVCRYQTESSKLYHSMKMKTTPVL